MKAIKVFLAITALLAAALLRAQQPDSVKVELQELVLPGKPKSLYLKQAKPLAAIEDYLQQSGKVTMVKRGAYAWEPLINNMGSERTLITIDGMHIFGACTDKMDPITSYVEISNLSEATVASGQQGGSYGATIGGALDLKRAAPGYNSGWKASANSGYETNGNQFVAGAAAGYSSEKFFAEATAMKRKADDYRAGNGTEVRYSQFGKVNFSGTAGVALSPGKALEASVIYDEAANVGYPALPMDVSLARAVIGSLKYKAIYTGRMVSSWESKLYYNAVRHRMDDTGRDFVPMHMDMPGQTDTYGGYSAVAGAFKKHNCRATLNSFYNRALADMTMYPAAVSENPMYMLTWPDVRTLYNGISLEDTYTINCHSSVKATAGTGMHRNAIASESGRQSLDIFYPGLPGSKSRILNSASVTYSNSKFFDYSAGLGYGERAPSVSEGYGFYLFNSFDRYDYIGNPVLGKERSIEANLSAALQKKNWSARLSAAGFRISNYIIGRTDASLLPMTLGASGVKRYVQLPYATILNIEGQASVALSPHFNADANAAWARGTDNDNGNLPLISPLRYRTALTYKVSRFRAGASLSGNAAQLHYAPAYGEDRTPSYIVANVDCGYSFDIDQCRVTMAAGIENITDAKYSTYSDWNNIPRKGRNVFFNLVCKIR